MKGLIPYAGIQVDGGVGTQALSTTVAAVDFSGLGGVATDYTAGDPAARPDIANDRLILGPGVYEIDAQLCGTIDGAQILTMSVLKNGAVISGSQRQYTWVVAAAEQIHTLKAIITLAESDVPGTIKNFDDPASTSYTGAGGATKQGIPVSLGLKSGAGTPTVTIKNAIFLAKRIG